MPKNKIKILHTSDWHLGKRLFKKERLQEQSFFLNWLLQKIMDENIDLLIVAGDIFDVPSPPVDALKVYYDFLFELSQNSKCEVVIISGNHDSKRLLAAPSPILKNLHCHIYTDFSKPDELTYRFKKQNQSVHLKLLPYFRNYELFNLLEESNLSDDKKDIESFFTQFFTSWNNTEECEFNKKILVAHHGFGEYSTGGSEQVIQLSGLDYFPINWVRDHFDYVALGHIHKKQSLSVEPPIIYTGAPLPMRFSESNKKYISIIEIEGDSLTYDFHQIPLQIKLESIRAKASEVELKVKELIQKTNEKTYLELIVDLEEAKSGIADSARELLKDTCIELISFIPIFNTKEKDSQPTKNINSMNIEELFEEYYKHKLGSESIPKELKTSFLTLLESTQHEN